MSKFPSLEEFDAGQTTAKEGIDESDLLDGTGIVQETESNLLNREQAALGDDAIFNNSSIFPSESDNILQETPQLDEQKVENNNSDSIFVNNVQEDEETEPIREWRERQNLTLERRDAQSESVKQETLAKARQAVDDFYTNYNEKKDSAHEKTEKEAKEFIAARDDTITGNTWERISKLVDLSQRGAKSETRDKSRFRDLLVSLKDDKAAPGAGGY